MNYLPSKKFLSIVIALALVGGGLWFITPASKEVERGTLSIETAPKDSLEPSQNGVNMMSSISSGAEPLPPQKFITSPALTGGLLQDVAALYQNGGGMDDATKQELAKKVADNAQNFFSKNLNIYTEADVVVDDSVAPRDYLNQLSGIIQKYFSDDPKDPNYENEVLVIFRIVNDRKSPEELSYKLQKYIYRYRSAAEELVKIKTPLETAIVHLDFVNSFWNTAVALTAISKYKDDPVAGALGMSIYEEGAGATADVLKKAKAIAETHNIVFTKDDPGYFLQTYFEKIKS